MELKNTEGIILNVIPYQNFDQILTLFTPERGLLKFFCKKSKTKSQRFAPLTKVEVIYIEKKSELFVCEEINPIQSYLNLRNNLSHLQASCDLLRDVYSTQFVDKPAPLLYQLLNFYLDKISVIQDPYVLSLSFKLKILKHEGIFDWEANSYTEFAPEEIELLNLLAHTQSYQPLSQVVLPNNFREKVEKLFYILIQEI